MAGSFHIEMEVQLDADPTRLWVALIDVGGWWSHHFTEVPTAVILEPFPGGRFYEDFGLEGGGGALYAHVVYLKHSEALRLMGPLGMPGPVIGDITFRLRPQGAATALKLVHRVFGEVDEGARERYLKGWHELLNVRLKEFVEHGRHYQPGIEE